MIEPALTSVRFDGRGMGGRAVELVCEAVETRARVQDMLPNRQYEMFPVELVVRDSTAPAAI
ncbi:MAG: hypothetical protein M3347_12845 [Armatimonadota bacterium]|nr:hypothetical protein [Armatimonadota bacterium]